MFPQFFSVCLFLNQNVVTIPFVLVKTPPHVTVKYPEDDSFPKGCYL